MERKNVVDNNPRLGFDWISCKTPFRKSCASEGATDKKKDEKVSSIFVIGINGMRLSTKIKNGKSAIKKLKAIALALIVRAPWIIPKIYISSKS